MVNEIAVTLQRVFESVNVSNSNGEPANIVDVLDKLSVAIGKLAEAIENHSGLIAEIGLYE